MTIRLSLAAALLGAVALTSPAFAIEQIHIPDASAAQNSGPPDALFDKSVPTTWQQKQTAAAVERPRQLPFLGRRRKQSLRG